MFHLVPPPAVRFPADIEIRARRRYESQVSTGTTQPKKEDGVGVKILLVDDHPVLRLTLRRWLERARDLQVVGEAEPGSPVLALIQLVDPDVVLVDVHASPEAGLNTAKSIHDQYPDLPIVAIGDAKNGKLRAESARAGAWAYFPNQRPAEMAKAIRSVIAQGGKEFIDVNKVVSQRPAPESFVALPDHRPQRKHPQPAPTPIEEISEPLSLESIVALPGEGSPPTKPVSVAGLPDEGAPPTEPLSFVGLPENGSTPKAPKPARAKQTGTVRRSASKPVKRVPNAQPKQDRPKRSAAAAPQSPARFDLGADKPPRRKAQGVRKTTNGEVVLVASEVRGPTGLPRRFGGHR